MKTEFAGCIEYDDWLDQFEEIVQACDTPIIDLGCGGGNDTKYLTERGKRVLACDISAEKIDELRKAIPQAEALCLDMREKLPFADNSTKIVIADLSLHFFDREMTFAILEEIKRVLTLDGVLFFRVNSMPDYHTDRPGEVELEPHFYRTERGCFRRFFDRSDIETFFYGWKFLHLKAETMNRYRNPKYLWTGAVRVNKQE